MTLTVDDVERVSARVAELVRDELAVMLGAHSLNVGPSLVDVATVASTLAVSAKFVRKHAQELGGRQLVPGGPWRFDLAVALAANAQPVPASVVPRTPRPRPAPRSSVELLPIRGSVVNG